MKVYSKDNIETARQMFKNLFYRLNKVNVAGKKLEFFDIPQQRNPDLPCFAYVCAGKKEDGYVIGVSDEVYEPYKKLWAFHEFVEYAENGADNKIRCIDALDIELCAASIELVSANAFRRYVAARKEFFENLVKYVREKPDQYTQSDISEYEESLALLVRLNASS
ncbi:MAG: hypothetical protein QXM31_00300 [Candidatus Woesearchaeota archaeon]